MGINQVNLFIVNYIKLVAILTRTQKFNVSVVLYLRYMLIDLCVVPVLISFHHVFLRLCHRIEALSV